MYIPLKSQSVKFITNNQNANFTIIQNYTNIELNPIEAFFTFPVPTEASVYFFEARLDDGTIIECNIKEKDKAKEDYNEAINQGNTAYYMEKQSDGIFSIAIGNLAPKTNINICFKYALELKNETNHLNLRINFPLTLMPRYTSIYQSNRSSNGVSSNNSILQNPEKISEKPFNLFISGDIIMSDGIKSLNSKTHQIKISNMKENSLHFDIENLDKLNQDIILTIERNHSTSHAIVQKFTGMLHDQTYKYCTAINIVPDFDKLPDIDVRNIHYVLLLDKSGSMKNIGYHLQIMNYDIQTNIEICKLAAKQFIALLPVGSTFDIYVFNTNYDKFKCSADAMNDLNKQKIEASEWIDSISADGGTELLPVLTNEYKK